MRRDVPPASKAQIRMEDLAEVPLMISRASQSYLESAAEAGNLKIIGTNNLIFNASLLVESGVCCALGFGKQINTIGDSGLHFRPLAGQNKGSSRKSGESYEKHLHDPARHCREKTRQ